MTKNKVDKNGEIALDMKSYYTGPGVYFLYNEGELVYIGQTTNVARRILRHIEEGLKDFDAARYTKVPEDSLSIVEATLIKNLRPIYNIKMNDGEHISFKCRTKKSRITISPCVGRPNRNGVYSVRIRVTYQRRSFFIGTNLKAYAEDVKGSTIVNKKLIQEGLRIAKPFFESSKFISADATFEYVKTRLTKVKI